MARNAYSTLLTSQNPQCFAMIARLILNICVTSFELAFVAFFGELSRDLKDWFSFERQWGWSTYSQLVGGAFDWRVLISWGHFITQVSVLRYQTCYMCSVSYWCLNYWVICNLPVCNLASRLLESRADPGGVGQRGHGPSLTQKGANVSFGPTFHLCSFSETTHLFTIFSLFSSTPRSNISIFVQIWQWPCWTIFSKFPCWKSNRKTVPWINVWQYFLCWGTHVISILRQWHALLATLFLSHRP